ncbi:MAG TPA: DUF2203 domain-containing protein [Thermoanaerobaculia bacterium]|nr:DUF2203 domain-containing protein [Thermoanaerobaculia bacterium]
MKKTFTYEEASALLPEVQRITEDAVAEGRALPSGAADEGRQLLAQWVADIEALGVEVKGLWLVDFDCGVGYYCWQYPEPSLQFFHGYEEGFGGRVPMV